METTATTPLELAVIEAGALEETKQLLIDRFTTFFEQAQDWKDRAESLVVTDVSQTREMKMAREARLALREIRINADKVRKELKEDSLRYGRAVQAVYNVIENAITPIEKHLEQQEKYKEIQEMKQREALRIEREELAKDVREYMIANINLGEITQEDFDNLLSGARLQKKAAIEAAQRAELERIEREKAAEAERERLRIENERLEAERMKLIDEQRKANMAAAKARKEAEAKAAAERAERERLEAELREKKEAEERAEAERLAAIEAELSKGDKEKFEDLLQSLENLKTKYQFSSKKYKSLQLSIVQLIDKTITYANTKL